ncbi:MAG: hypothetical protein BWX98_01618 [Candidatus Aminicenantes bacterium ADurb.Bin147]|nr:MAG: hypothetical protein BWX98_01618 [Candidatus Aminicenantes bacterium ADurb.Bin147]
MLFRSTGAAMVKRSLLEAKWNADQERQAAALNKLNLYKDDYEDLILAAMKKEYHPDNYRRLRYHVNPSQNILKRVVNEISMVYKAPAQRGLFSAAGEEIESDRYTQILAETKIGQKMKKANRYTNLENETMIFVTVRGGKIVYDVLTPNLVTVVQDEDDPTRARAIVYRVDLANTPGETEPRYYYWDDQGTHSILDKNFVERQPIYTPENYPYRDAEGQPVMPFVVIHRNDPDGSFWDQDTGNDLYNSTILIGVKMSMFDYYFKAASFKQIYIRTEGDVPSDQVMDISTALVVRGDHAEVGVLDIQANLKQLQDALVFQINSIINNYGISADQWTVSVSELSGRALKIKNRALLEAREEQLPTYLDAEKDLFDITRIVNNAHLPDKLPEDAEFGITFGEIEYPEEPAADLRQKREELRAGIISLGAFYRHFNPDVEDDTEAEQTIIKNLEKLAKLRQQHPTLDEALNFIMANQDEDGKKRARGRRGFGRNEDNEDSEDEE